MSQKGMSWLGACLSACRCRYRSQQVHRATRHWSACIHRSRVSRRVRPCQLCSRSTARLTTRIPHRALVGSTCFCRGRGKNRWKVKTVSLKVGSKEGAAPSPADLPGPFPRHSRVQRSATACFIFYQPERPTACPVLFAIAERTASRQEGRRDLQLSTSHPFPRRRVASARVGMEGRCRRVSIAGQDGPVAPVAPPVKSVDSRSKAKGKDGWKAKLSDLKALPARQCACILFAACF